MIRLIIRNVLKKIYTYIHIIFYLSLPYLYIYFCLIQNRRIQRELMCSLYKYEKCGV